MAIISKTVETQSTPVAADLTKTTAPAERQIKLEAKLKRARDLMAKGEYQLALGVLPAANQDIEVRNICAVCLMRMNRFKEAIGLLRTVTLNTQINRVREDVADHIRINFAIALFFGGQPAGGLEALQEIDRENDSSVIMLREQTRRWVSQMTFWRRLDWRMSRIAPRTLPVPPDAPLGKCFWDVA